MSGLGGTTGIPSQAVTPSERWTCFSSLWNMSRCGVMCPIFYRMSAEGVGHKKSDEFEMKTIRVPDRMTARSQQHARMLIGYPPFVCVTDADTLVVTYSALVNVMGPHWVHTRRSHVPFPLKSLEQRMVEATEDVARSVRDFPAFYPVFMRTPALLMMLLCVMDTDAELVDGISHAMGADPDAIRADLEQLERDCSGLNWDTQVSTGVVVQWYKYFLHGMRYLDPAAPDVPKFDHGAFCAAEREAVVGYRKQLSDLMESNERVCNVVCNVMPSTPVEGMDRKHAGALFDTTAVNAMRAHDVDVYKKYIAFLEGHVMDALGMDQQQRGMMRSGAMLAMADVSAPVFNRFMDKVYGDFVRTRLSVSQRYLSSSCTHIKKNRKNYPPAYELLRMLLFFNAG